MNWKGILEGLISLIGLLRSFFNWLDGAQQREAGRAQVRAEVNEKAAQKQKEMAEIAAKQVTSDAVEQRLKDGTF